MKLFSVLSFLIFFCLSVTGQLYDDFSDGDFTTNPTWIGDTMNFQINNDGMLQSNGSTSSADTLVLAASNFIMNNVEWRFFMKLDFNPTSSTNYVKIYLVSDSPELKSSLNGYFLRIGETGQSDTLELFRQSGNSVTKILTGLTAFKSTTQASIKVTLDTSGNWSLYVDPNGGTNYIYEGSTIDNVHVSTAYFGVYCKYSTTSRFNQYFFDDFNIAYIIPDTIPPYINNALIIGNNKIELEFSEPLTNSAEDVNNYYINSINNNPFSVNINSSKYELTFNNIFIANDTLKLNISNISDLSNNLHDTLINLVVPDTARKGDLLINELLFDPLTGCEDFVEIYNTTNSSFDLNQFLIGDYDNGVGNLKLIDQHFIIGPKEYAVLTEDTMVVINDYPSNNNEAFIQTDLPSFPNDSATVYILSPDSNIIDGFSYNDDMHFELINDPEGVSLEKIDPYGESSNVMLWHSASENSGWGTPGKMNSQNYNTEMRSSVFEVQTKVFSPDNDGVEDIALFNYNLSSPGFVGSVHIYDNLGRLIKRVLNNELLGNSGILSWDGTNELGQKAAVGIYMVYFEYFNSSGDVFSQKSAVTLKTRF
tara:strand:+ start:672 stop:2450 length:1779 start_codon:yes stop_codon:yes gene_type:complete